MAKTPAPTTDLELDDELGSYHPDAADLAAARQATIPELAAYRDAPSKETHLAAARLLHKTGSLVLDGMLYELKPHLMGGKKVHASPAKRDFHQGKVVPDDPREIL